MSGSGFIYQLICAAAQIMSVIVSGTCIEELLTGRDDRGTKRMRVAVWSIWGSVPVIIKCMFVCSPFYYSVINPVLIMLGYVLVPVYFYRDKVQIRVLHVSMIVLQRILADTILFGIFGNVKNTEHLNISFASPYMAERVVMAATLGICLNFLYTVIVIELRKKKSHTTSSAWLAVMLQMVFVAFIFCVVKWLHVGNDDFVVYFSSLCIYCILLFLVVMLYVGQLEKRETQDRVLRLQRENELRKAHYEQIEIRRREMAKLRSSYGTTLTSILNLLEQGEKAEVEKLLKDLSVQISATKEYPFCAVPIVNAILTEKQKVCEEEGISQNINLMIPEETGIAELDLCMIFGNLMDNAIRACKEMKAHGKPSDIRLNGGIVREYLIIKCTNTALENRKNKIWGTGYGHKILADIAKKYDGDFQTLYEGKMFSAQICLRLRN